MILVWTIVFAVCLIIEFITIGEFVTIWFSLGALITVIATCLKVSKTIQVVIFVVSSIISLLVLRPICLKFLTKSDVKTNLEAIKDTTIKLIDPIINGSMGSAKLDGVLWNCSSENGEEIASGTNCTVVEIKGNKLIVKAKY